MAINIVLYQSKPKLFSKRKTQIRYLPFSRKYAVCFTDKLYNANFSSFRRAKAYLKIRNKMDVF